MAAPAHPTDAERHRLARLTVGFVVLLLFQAVLGVLLSLYVTLPSGALGKVLTSGPLIVAHVVVALLLLGFSVHLLLRVVRWSGHAARWYALVPVVAVVVAIEQGLEFSVTGSRAYSLGMAGATLVALVFALALRWSVRDGAPTPAAPATPP